MIFHDPSTACVDAQRGIQYADGGVADLNVHYPDPERMKRINEEWEAHDG